MHAVDVPHLGCGVTEAGSAVEEAPDMQFSDKDEHMYFWFPLLAGLSELTFDPRPDIRYSALEASPDLQLIYCQLCLCFCLYPTLARMLQGLPCYAIAY